MPKKSLLTKEVINRYNAMADKYFKEIPQKEFLLRKPFSTYQNPPFVLVRLDLLFKTLGICPGITVLDFGAGSCWLSSFLNKIGCKTIAVDVSSTALEIGMRLFELDKTHDLDLNPRFLTYDGYTFPIEDRSVDAIISFDAFHHVPNPETILSEIFRVLKDKGKVGFCEPRKGHSRSQDAIEEMEMYHVFEGEVIYKNMKKTALKIGFDRIRAINPLAMIASRYRWGFFPKVLDSYWPFHRLMAYLFKIIILEKGYRISPRSTWPSRLISDIQTERKRIEIGPNELFEIRGRVKNKGDTVWAAQTPDGLGKVQVGVHLKGEQCIQDYARADLESDITPGERCSFSIALKSPRKPGEYELEIDMVNEGICWFKDRKGRTAVISMRVS